METLATTLQDQLLETLLNGRAYTRIELANNLKANRKETTQTLNHLQSKSIVHCRENRKRDYYYIPQNQLTETKTTHNLNPKHTAPNALKGMKYCRHCYNHLAGYVGVQTTQALVHKGFLIPQGVENYNVTKKGWRWFLALGI